MSAPESLRQQVITHCRQTYGDIYDTLKFPTTEIAQEAEQRRDELLERLSVHTHACCGATKRFTNGLPTGCTLCAERSWSCLFIGSVCNANCFFCPKPGDVDSKPAAENLTFERVSDYTTYLRLTGFRGVGISGGEPLLKQNTAIKFLSGIKREFGNTIHTWLYTNGSRAGADNLKALRDAGLDEIRFNIAAIEYDTTPVRHAVGLFREVVVEIPAVPEDSTILSKLPKELEDVGATGLNLHQLWCSPQNVRSLADREYTFLRGSRISVLESELTALEVLESAALDAVDMPVHYCSSVFKDRYQTAAALRQNAYLAKTPHEEVTESGLIRQISITIEASEYEELRRSLEAAGIDAAECCYDPEANKLLLPACLTETADLGQRPCRIQYDVAFPTPAADSTRASTVNTFGSTTLALSRSTVKIIPNTVLTSGWMKDEELERVERGEPDYF